MVVNKLLYKEADEEKVEDSGVAVNIEIGAMILANLLKRNPAISTVWCVLLHLSSVR
jgi:hypothetical protein